MIRSKIIIDLLFARRTYKNRFNISENQSLILLDIFNLELELILKSSITKLIKI